MYNYDRAHSKLYYPLGDVGREGFFFVLPYRELWTFMSFESLSRLRNLYPASNGAPLWMVISYIYDRSGSVWGIADVRVSLAFCDPCLPFILGARVIYTADGKRVFYEDHQLNLE